MVSLPRGRPTFIRTVWQPHYARRVLITDAAAIVLAMLFAQWVRFGGAGYGPSASMLYTGYSLALACLWVGWAARHRIPPSPSFLKAEGR